MYTETLEYAEGGQRFQGYLACSSETEAPKPLILIAHTWSGRDEFVCQKADALARLGYVGFAMDLYGDARVGKSNEENTALMEPLIKDRALLRQRLQASLEAASAHQLVDRGCVGAIGFCFGGLSVLDLARSGADVQGVVSFHGLLMPAEGLPQGAVKAKVLALHGYDDPMVPPEHVMAFAHEMTQAGADWQLHAYGHTKHAFTNPEANDAELGTIYNPDAEQRSWQAMRNFFEEVLV